MTLRPEKSTAAARSTDSTASVASPMREKAASGVIVREQPLFGRLVGGRYRIRSFVGGGVIGATYLARRTSQDRNVAVKAVHSALARRPGFGEAFLREAKVAALIDHAAFVKVLDFGEEPDGTLFVAMEHVEGRTLADLLSEAGPLAEDRIVSLVAQVLRGLSAVHQRGYVHRGLDPQNMFVVAAKDGAAESVKVADFGIAALRQLDDKGLGHAAYSAPEQARGGKADKRSDIYAMGVVLYEMLTGKFPAVGSPSESAPHASAALPSCSKRLADVAFRAMQRMPASRYPSARAMLDGVLGKSALSDRTTAMAAQDFEDEVDEADVMSLPSDAPPEAVAVASQPTAVDETNADSRIQRREARPAPEPEEVDATRLDIMAMPDDLPNRTLIMAVSGALPAAPESSGDRLRAEPSGSRDAFVAPELEARGFYEGPSSSHRAMLTPAGGPKSPRRRDWVPLAQGLAVFAGATTVGLTVLFAFFS